MDPVSAILTVLSLIPDLISTKGGRIIGGVYVRGKYYSSIALERAFPMAGARGRRRTRTNVWLRYLREFRKYVNRNYSMPNRMRIAKEIYERLRQSGQLDVLIKHHQLPGPLEFPFVFSESPTVPRPSLEIPIGLLQPGPFEFPMNLLEASRQPQQPSAPMPHCKNSGKKASEYS